MCEPMTVMAVAGTLMTAYGSIEQGKAQNDVAQYNAKLAEVSATDAEQRGGVAADQQRARVRQILGTQRAMMGASGVVAGEGTQGQVLDQTSVLGELDARQIEVNAQREAWGMRSQAAGARLQGSLQERAGLLGGIGSLITGGAQAYGIYSQPRAGKVPASNASSTMTQAQYFKR